ncbi:TPA: RHS repeat-associated core domain-containing protein [Pseudomonas putida]|nr:RHS repeat-associated core domain-containing protein [Pseudomonas putida]
MRRLFYKDQQISSEINHAEACHMFRGARVVLGELHLQKAVVTAKLLMVDAQNTVRHVNEAQSYSAYGFCVAALRTSLIGFNGERRDTMTGCDLLGGGKRAYSSVLMRFYSPDGLSPFAEGGLNAYAYCGNDPVNYTDPSAANRWRNIVLEKVIPNLKAFGRKRSLWLEGMGAGKRLKAASEVDVVNVSEQGGGPASLELSPLANEIYLEAIQRYNDYRSSVRQGSRSKLSPEEIIGGLAVDIGKRRGGTRTFNDVVRGLKPELKGKKVRDRKELLKKHVAYIGEHEDRLAVEEIRKGE